MREETKALILYRLQRAHEALEEADILFEQGYANTCVNRLYYCKKEYNEGNVNTLRFITQSVEE